MSFVPVRMASRPTPHVRARSALRRLRRRVGSDARRGVSAALAVLFAATTVLPVMPLAPVQSAYAAADTTVNVSSTSGGTFANEIVGGNLSPWGMYWPSTQYNALLSDTGVGSLRWGHASKIYTDMEKFYPTKGGTPNWDAPPGQSYIGSGHTFNDQIAWLKSRNLPVLYTLSDEMSTAMLKADKTLDYAEVARVWTLHIKHFIDAGVDIRWIEIGNECDISPGEGIQLPPVRDSTGAGAENPNFIDPMSPQNSTNAYIQLWNAVYPALKAQFPNIKIGAYPAGIGPIQTNQWPYDYLFKTSQYKPDFFAFHYYPEYQGQVPTQKSLDYTWSYAGAYVDWDDQLKTFRSILTGWGAPASTPIFCTEYNYDSSIMYSTNDQMWDGVYVASALLNAGNGGLDGMYFWDTFCGSDTGGAIGPNYETRLTSEGFGLRLMKQFKGRTVLKNTITTSDYGTGPVSPGDGHAISPNVSTRVEALATKSGSSYKLMLINKNITTAHQVALNLASLGLPAGQSAKVDVYDSRTSLANNTPTTSTQTVTSGSITVSMPALSVAVVSIDAAPTVFAVIGDYGMDDANEAAVATLVKSWSPSYIVTTGDDYYSEAGGSGTAKYDESTGAYYGDYLKDITTTGTRFPVGKATVNSFFPSLGNHDYTDATLATYQSYFTLPGAGFTNSSGNERYYDFVEGPIHFFVLNSNTNEAAGTDSASNQAKWLQAQLAASTSTYNVVYDHHPPFSSDDTHGSTTYMQWPFAAWGADAVISGHAHTYERIIKDGIPYFVNGLGGAAKYGFTTPVTGSAIRYNSGWGAQKVTVTDAGLNFEFYNTAGTLIDSYQVTSGTAADTTAPTVSLTAPTNGSTVSGSVALAATASDNVGVTRVEFRVDGSLVASDTSSPYAGTWNASGASAGSHTIEARAYDAAGNTTNSAASVTVSSGVSDTTAPTVSITSPTNGSNVSGTVTIAANASDSGSGVARVEFRVNGVLIGTDTSAPYSTNWSVPTTTAATGPVVSFTFDDGNDTQYTQYMPVLRDAGYTGTCYINTGKLGSMYGTMTLTQLRALRDMGWEISSHTTDHGDSLPANPTAAQCEAIVADAKTWLDANGFPNSGFATPGGTTGSFPSSMVSKYHPYNRQSFGTATFPISNPYNLPMVGTEQTTLSALKPYLDTIQSSKGWCIFVNHGWEAPTVFQQLVTEVKSRGIPVRNVRDVIAGTGASSTYTIQATAYDVAGNSAASTSTVTAGTSGGSDTTPPTVSVTSPTNNSTVSGSVALAASASDNVGVTKVEFRVDGTLVGTDSSAPYAGTWNASTATIGGHTVQARAYDAAGNTANSSVTVTVPDTAAPTVSLTAPSTGSTVMGDTSLSATAADNVGVTKVEFRVDGTVVGTDNAAPYSMTWNADSVSGGSHTIQARACDAAGNTANSSATVTVPTAPDVAIISPGAGTMVHGLVGIAANASDTISGVAKVEFRVDGSAIGTDTTYPFGWMWDATNAAQGNHTIEARAYNKVGLTRTTSIAVVVPIVSTPTVSITSPSANSIVSGQVGLSANATDSGSGVGRVEFRVDGSVIGTDTTYPYGWLWDATNASPGTHVIQAKAINRLGTSTIATIPVTVPVPAVTLPTVAITSPANGAIVAGAVGISATADDTGSGVATVQFKVDGASIGTDTTSPYGWLWDATSASTGSHTIEAVARNRMGNSSTHSISVVVPSMNPSVPTVSITSPKNGAVVSGNVGISATATDTGSGIAKVEFRVDGSVIGTDTTYPYGWSWSSAGASAGAHSIEARAFNRAGTSASSSVSVILGSAGVGPQLLSDPQAPLLASEDPLVWEQSALAAAASRTAVPARTAVTLKGQVFSAGEFLPERADVTVWRWTGSAWAYEGLAIWNAAAHSYTLGIKPSTSTSYMLYFGGDPAYQATASKVVTVRTYPKLTTTPTVASSNRFRVGGRLTISGKWYYQAPRSVTVVIYRKVGSAWKRYGSVRASFKRTSSSGGTYTAYAKLSARGYWKVIAMPDTSAPSDACSPARIFRIY